MYSHYKKMFQNHNLIWSYFPKSPLNPPKSRHDGTMKQLTNIWWAAGICTVYRSQAKGQLKGQSEVSQRSEVRSLKISTEINLHSTVLIEEIFEMLIYNQNIKLMKVLSCMPLLITHLFMVDYLLTSKICLRFIFQMFLLSMVKSEEITQNISIQMKQRNILDPLIKY